MQKKQLTVVTDAQVEEAAQSLPLPWERDGVYFVEGAGLIKIGYSVQVFGRFNDLQNGNAVPLRFLGYIPGACDAVERFLHRHFANQRRHGEWFEPSDELRDLIAGRRPDIIHLYRPDEAARLLLLTPTLVRQLAYDNLLPAIYLQPRGALRFAAIDIDAVADRLADFLAERAA